MLGVLLAEEMPAAVRAVLVDVQHDLFDLGGELAIPGHSIVTDAQVARLETHTETFNADLAPLKEFILPAGTRAAALAHLARTVCRRAERSVVALARTDKVTANARVYLNRLSDLLFVLGRVLNRAAGGSDVLWRRDRVNRAPGPTHGPGPEQAPRRACSRRARGATRGHLPAFTR